ncbi:MULTISPECIES: adenylate cyclase [unclassified Bosea (in: a-proteobacteria)]|uniref:adenylate cyclase n=1 Tax=unclassified Bosea (in: a-proteobacteria) TaxID=2653178 RepID=UPI000F75F9AA|nr:MULTISPECIES: adenylate cyclase [unclassified Bosea (in: a-proteobacteria)]AZO81956.1 adenylate cyclase [Bosea sp. Tri-49]RXT16729.1 adenylate cyclase [Bosea sp. Tri-39]RXT42350.1 adenylate cyclase [Bosea sp. Tri-54]
MLDGRSIADGTDQARGLPSADDVRAELDRLIASPEFNIPGRAKKFLRYIVEETLAGRAARIKAYTVGTEVFDRDAAFDAQNDPVVRIEAGRLRRALERYYLIAGSADSVTISIPKGGYVPLFELRAARQAAPLAPVSPAPDTASMPPQRRMAWLGAGVVLSSILFIGSALLSGSRDGPKPTIEAPAVSTLAITPFANLGDIPEAKIYAEGLTEEVMSQVARFKELSVLGRETSRNIPPGADAAQIYRTLGARYVLEGSVRAATSQLRVTGRLLDARTGAVLWSQSYDNDLRARDLLTIQNDVAQKVATAIAQPYGIIFQADELRTGAKAPDNLEAYACSLRFYGYRTTLSAQSHGAIRGCLEQAVAANPGYATGWAMLSILYLDEDRFGFNPKPGSSAAIQRATDAARRAIRLDPANVRALQALMMALFFTQQPAEAFEIGERAVALNPNDTELLAELGTRVGQIGAWARGTALLEQALARNPAHSDYYHGVLAHHAYMQRDYRRAEAMIRQASLDKFPLYHFVAAIIYAQLDMKPQAAAAKGEFLRLLPKFFEDWEHEMAKRNYRPEDAIHLAEGARKAGFPLPNRTAAETAFGVASPQH